MGPRGARSAVHDSRLIFSRWFAHLWVSETIPTYYRTGRLSPPLRTLASSTHGSSCVLPPCPRPPVSGEICRVSGSETQPLAIRDLQPRWSVSVAAPWLSSSERAWWTQRWPGLTPGGAGKGGFGDRRSVHSPGFVCQSLECRENRDLEVGV